MAPSFVEGTLGPTQLCLSLARGALALPRVNLTPFTTPSSPDAPSRSACHELRNPLHAVMATLEFMSQDVALDGQMAKDVNVS